MSYPGKMLADGLCTPAVIEIPARQLLGTVCVCGGADCPLFESRQDALAILERVKADPTVSIRLTTDADQIPHYSSLDERDYTTLDREGVLNRKRDLAVLQHLGLTPGDTRRARYLYELLLQRIETPDGICAFDTPNWEGCPLARGGAYEAARAKGSREIVFDRTAEDKAEARRLSVERVRRDPVLKIRPHHLMCMSCWIGASGGEGVRGNDTLDEVYKRICRDPEVKIMLVEGNCEACHCCDGFHPDSARCVHACGLIRDYMKDLDVMQKLGVMPGTTMNARKLLMLIYERVTSTTDICGFGTGEANANEWIVCGGPDGNAGYLKARETVRF
ncbi:MAG: hypothetical protein KAI66_05515 [Lentisphaeria bacterium]|nr:hypothetical protein [Lentisphaeria bacterium]